MPEPASPECLALSGGLFTTAPSANPAWTTSPQNVQSFHHPLALSPLINLHTSCTLICLLWRICFQIAVYYCLSSKIHIDATHVHTHTHTHDSLEMRLLEGWRSQYLPSAQLLPTDQVRFIIELVINTQ